MFAQIYGTIQLLPVELRPLVRGIIINKFRGDPSIFTPGIRKIEETLRCPGAGRGAVFCSPPAQRGLPVHRRQESRWRRSANRGIRLPRIANFTDFELLEQYAAVDYVMPGAPLDAYDCLIIPGTKNTIDDLNVLKVTGTDRELKKARARGIPVIGICGGYQMLGMTLIDAGFESAAGTYPGSACWTA